MPRILSTKILAKNQKELLLNAGISLVEFDAIKIDFPDFKVENTVVKNGIFTSKNAVKAIIEKNFKVENCFCVGEKTASALMENGFFVKEVADTSAKLANEIVENYTALSYIFFSGSKRRDELPEELKKKNIELAEIEVYRTKLQPQEFHSNFDGIMFFSPSGVNSFIQKNKLNTTAFCIGNTTAFEARKYTEDIVIANKPGIENVIAKVVAKFT